MDFKWLIQRSSPTHRPMRGLGFLPFIAGALAAGIFLVDTFTSLDFAVAVLYVGVVLAAAISFGKRGILISAGVCIGLTILSYVLMHGSVLDEAAPLRAVVSLTAICITAGLTVMNLSANERLKAAEQERGNLARFFSPQLVDELVKANAPLSIARYDAAAVMFVDMVGFTAYCSGRAPAEVIAMLRTLLTRLSNSIFSHRGSVDKFLGDGAFAVFGPPLPTSCDATNAALCALDILRSMECWNEQTSSSGDEAIHIAIGIHYGDVVQGDVGTEQRLELTVVGDTVNIASRVESYCRSLGAAVLVTDTFVEALRQEGSADTAKIFADEGMHTLRGRTEPTHLYSIRWTRQDVFGPPKGCM